MTYSRFMELFPDNDACLEHLKEHFFPDGTECPEVRQGQQVPSDQGTLGLLLPVLRPPRLPDRWHDFSQVTVSLQLWFFAIYLMSSTRCGISAKQLEREIGVTYKTAHRIFKQIRTLLAEDDGGPLDGDVEVDEWPTAASRAPTRTHQQTMHRKATARRSWRWSSAAAACALWSSPTAALARSTWQSSSTSCPLRCCSRTNGMPTKRWRPATEATVGSSTKRRSTRWGDPYADGGGLFRPLQERRPGRLPRDQRRLPPGYLDEYAFRYNRRKSKQPMFWAMLNRVQKVARASS